MNNNHQSSKLILPNGKLNTTILENEIQNDISNHNKYYAEDEMKKRAVHISQDYNEFSNFVKCSQLKAVDSQEMKQLFVQRREGSTGGSSSENDSSFGTNRILNKAFAVNQCMEKRMNKLLNDVSRSNDDDLENDYDCHLDRSNLDQNQFSSCYEFMNPNVNTSSLKSKSEHNLDQNVNNTSTTVINNKNRSTKKEKQVSTMNINRKKKKNKSKRNESQGQPLNAMEFEKEWKLYCHSIVDILTYLTRTNDNMNEVEVNDELIKETKSSSLANQLEGDKNMFPINIHHLRIIPEQVPTSIFKVEINPDIMGKIIEALAYLLQQKHHHHQQQQLRNENYNDTTMLDSTLLFVFSWMDALSKCGRFGLNIDFLDVKQKECILVTFNLLEKFMNELSSFQKHIHSHAIFNEESLNHLRSMYNIL